MAITLDQLVNSTGEPEEQELHRSKEPKGRPDNEVTLLAVSKESKEHAKTQRDPTDDLVEIKEHLDEAAFNALIQGAGYLVFCPTTAQMWYAHDKLCLDRNFIYREDLDILTVSGETGVFEWFNDRVKDINFGIQTCKKCYILDNPGNETYEVYSDSNYPSVKYGKATPQGCFVHVYANRFHRDMAILELDDLYANSSNKQAGKLTAKAFGPREAIIVSDGAWMREQATFSYYYLDDKSVVHCTEGTIPSEPDQAVLISEINGAYWALKKCMERSKSEITYYYDNTSILNVFKNRKTEYITEIKRYKELLEKMHNLGYKINFVELHPKTGETRDTDNKALQYFHNRCDAACREMADTCKKDYKAFTTNGSKDGKTLAKLQEESKPKPKNPRGGYNNYKSGYNGGRR